VDDWPHFIVFDFVGFDHYNYIEIETSKQGKTKLQKKNINFLISIGLNIQIVYYLFPFFQPDSIDLLIIFLAPVCLTINPTPIFSSIYLHDASMNDICINHL